MSLGKELEERLAELKNALLTPDGAGVEEQEANLEEVVTLYENATSGQKEVATEIRQVFLLTLIETPDILAKEKFAAFLGEHIQPEDFSRLEWEAPEEVVSMCETLYGFHFDDESVSKGVREQVLNLLRCSLQQFEERGELEKMLQLLRLAPILPDIMDAELMRLRSRAYLYEMRRIQRNRRILYGYLILQVLLIFIVFPFLFINAENRAIQQQIEELTEVDLSPPEEGLQLLDFSDALYWSIITAGSIGYGDIVPQTIVGRALASALGLMGVITVGVIAGLILNWISPRRID